MKFKSENTKGILIAFLGALLLTPDTLFMRLSEMNVWTMLFWRGFQMGAILILMTLSIKEYRENFFLIFKKTGTLIVLIQASGSVFFTLGIVNSSVALILFCIATGPLFAAFFSLIILKEKLKRPTIYASIFSLIGIIIVVTDPSEVLNAPDGSVVFGTVCGLLTAISLGLYFVLLRANPKIPAFGTTGFGAIITGFVGLLFIDSLTLESKLTEEQYYNLDYTNKVCFCGLSCNTNAIKLLKENKSRIHWGYLSENVNALDLIESKLNQEEQSTEEIENEITEDMPKVKPDFSLL